MPRHTPRGDHSSRPRIASGLKQPTRGSQHFTLASETPFVRRSELWASIRAGPALPSYLALLHAGFSVPRMLPSGRWALTPPFHPCQMRQTKRGGLPVFPKACRRGASITGGLVFCGTFRSCVARMRFRTPCDATPWRYQARCPAAAGSCEFATAGVRTFLPPIPLARSGPAITRLTRWNDYTRCCVRESIVGFGVPRCWKG